MSSTFFNVSGTDPNDGAKIVYVWCHAEGQENDALVATGHVVSADVRRPPGIRVGQFSVTFPLPPGCSADSVVVTNDPGGKTLLRDVTVVHCATAARLQPGVSAALAAATSA